jgi:hypothetical protein
VIVTVVDCVLISVTVACEAPEGIPATVVATYAMVVVYAVDVDVCVVLEHDLETRPTSSKQCRSWLQTSCADARRNNRISKLVVRRDAIIVCNTGESAEQRLTKT